MLVACELNAKSFEATALLLGILRFNEFFEEFFIRLLLQKEVSDDHSHEVDVSKVGQAEQNHRAKEGVNAAAHLHHIHPESSFEISMIDEAIQS